MDIKKAILSEHSIKNTLRIVTYIGPNPTLFKKLITVFLGGPYRVSQRASWPLSICVEHYPELINPYFGVLLRVLKKENEHPAVRRNIVRLLQFVDIPKQYAGKVWSVCYSLMNPNQPVAIRAFSMTVLANIAANEPDLKNELKLLIEQQLPYASAGYLARARKVLKLLKK